MLARKSALLALVSLVLLVSGCGGLPKHGPTSTAIVEASKTENAAQANFHLVEMSDATVAELMAETGPSMRSSFGQNAPAPRQVFAVGDTLSISLFESASGGLFFGGDAGASTGARQVAFPNQTIGEDGHITVPYAGSFRAVGNTPASLARMIEAKFDERAIEPQVMISVVESTANSATVMGEVSNSGRVKLSLGGEKLLTVLADAGVEVAENEAVVRLVRRGRPQTVALSTIINTPSENIYVFPGDTIFVLKDPQVFNVMGAVNKPGQYDIGVRAQTFAGALSLAGGLVDSMADAGGVFVFRFETIEVARRLLGPAADIRETPAGVPMVYRIHFSDPNSFFWLQQLQVRSNDTIFVSNAVAVEFDKFVSLITRGTGFGARLSNL